MTHRLGWERDWERQRQVLAAKEKTYREIAAELGVSERWLRRYRSQLRAQNKEKDGTN